MELSGEGVVRVALDSSLLLALAEEKVDVFGQARALAGRAEFVVPRQVVEELKGLRKRGTKMARKVELVEKELKRYHAGIVEGLGGNADDALAELSRQGCVVATNDRGLRKRLTGRHLFLRQKKHLEWGAR